MNWKRRFFRQEQVQTLTPQQKAEIASGHLKNALAHFGESVKLSGRAQRRAEAKGKRFFDLALRSL